MLPALPARFVRAETSALPSRIEAIDLLVLACKVSRGLLLLEVGEGGQDILRRRVCPAI